MYNIHPGWSCWSQKQCQTPSFRLHSIYRQNVWGPAASNICNSQENHWFVKKIAKCNFFNRNAKRLLYTQCKICRKLTHFHVWNFLAWNCGCVKIWYKYEVWARKKFNTALLVIQHDRWIMEFVGWVLNASQEKFLKLWLSLKLKGLRPSLSQDAQNTRLMPRCKYLQISLKCKLVFDFNEIPALKPPFSLCVFRFVY